MGLFSSKYKTYVGTSISSFVDAKEFISANKKGVISGIARNESMLEHTLEYLVNGSGFRAKKAFNYSETDYTFGRPKDTLFSLSNLDVIYNLAIKEYLLNTEEAQKVYYTKFGEANYFHKLFKLLASDYLLDFATGELSTLTLSKGTTVTLKSIQLRVNPLIQNLSSSSFSPINYVPYSVEESFNVTGVAFEITYSWIPALSTVAIEETIQVAVNFSFDTLYLKKTYCLASYKSSTGLLTFLDYEINSGITKLDALTATSYTVPGDYLPRLYFRWNALASNSDKSSTEYLHSKKLAKKMGVAYDKAIEAIHKVDETRSAEDLEQIKSVFMMYGVQADASSQIELQYLYKHFENWYGIIGGVPTKKALSDFNSTLTTANLFEHVLVIEDKRFKITLGMQGIYKRTVTDSVGTVGSYSNAIGNLDISYEVEGSENGTYTVYTNYPWHVYRYQDTETSYIEYQVVGLETKYYVSGDHVSASGWTADVNDVKDILYVPVNYTLVQTMGVFDQEEIMYKSMHIVANSLVVQKIKWYQTGFWKMVFIVVAVVAAFYGFVEGFKMLSAIAAVAGVSMVWAIELALAAIIDLLTAVLVTKLFVKVAGEELAFLVAIVASAYSLGSSGFKMNMPFASDMLAFSNSVFKEIGSVYQDKMQDLMGEFELFQKEAKEQMDALNVIKDSLDKPSALGKLYIGESAEDYYAKSHAGNIGTRVYDLQTNYVDLALKLPRTFNNYEV